MNTTSLITIALPKRAAVGAVVAQLLAIVSAGWLAPLPATLILCGGVLAIVASFSALFRPDRLVALRMVSGDVLTGRTASGADVRLDLLDHRVIGGVAVALKVRSEANRNPQNLLLLAGDQSERDLHALRVYLVHRPSTASLASNGPVSAFHP